MKIKKNDTVVVITGKDVKKVGKVIAAMPAENKIVVEGVNVQVKNRKARTAQETSTIIKKEGPIDASNALVICPACGKATRVGYSEVDGKKVRTCKKCKANLDAKVAKAEPAKKTRRTKKAEETVETEVTEVKKTTRRRTKKVETSETEA